MGKNATIVIAVAIVSVMLGIDLTLKFGYVVGLTAVTTLSVLGLIAGTLLDIRGLLHDACKKG